ncbi:hypothetical protein KGR20_23350 [Cytobacillus oceanisediminis]|nr:hypothetical protein [Cytobacillus oceanisediminis]MBZ9537099.1 hypothetical protein [Cytobacillus oceanisediminis]
MKIWTFNRTNLENSQHYNSKLFYSDDEEGEELLDIPSKIAINEQD